MRLIGEHLMPAVAAEPKQVRSPLSLIWTVTRSRPARTPIGDLEALGELAELDLRKALGDQAAPGVRKRLEALLESATDPLAQARADGEGPHRSGTDR